MTWKRFIDFLLPLFLILVYLFVQVDFLRPPALEGGDQLDYFSTARDLPEVSPTHRHLRLGLVIPVRAAIGVFGYSEAAYYTVPFLSGVALALATYALGRMLFTKWVGFLAGALVVLNPYVLWESSHLLPDITSTALVTGGLALLIHGSRQSDEENHQIGRASMFFVAGLLLGWAYLAREFIVLIYPVALLIWILYKPRFRHVALTAAGALVMLAFEMTWGWIVYQNPLQRISVVIGHSASTLSPEAQARVAQAISEGALQWQQPLSELVMMFPGQLLGRAGGELYVLVIALLGTALVVNLIPAARNNSVLITGVWAIAVIGAMTLIAGTPGPSGRVILRLHKTRYWFPVLPALLVGGFGAFTVGASWLRRRLDLPGRFAGIGITVMALFLGWIAVQGVDSIAYSGSFIRNGGGSHYLELRDWLATEGQEFDALWTDTDHGRAFGLILPMYAKTFWGRPIWQGELHSFNDSNGPIESSDIDAPIALNQLSLSGLKSMPEFVTSPPSSWSPALVSSNAQLVIFDPRDQSSKTVLLTEAGTESSTPWILVPRRGTTFEEREPWTEGTLRLEEGDHLYLLDKGMAGFGVPESSHSLAPKASVTGNSTLSYEGSGSIRVLCFFYEPDGDRATVPAWSITNFAPTLDLSSTRFHCSAPDTADSYRLRIGVELRGPLAIEALHLEAGFSSPDGDVD